MKSSCVTVSNRGYIVLPVKLRKEMNIKAGSWVLLSREGDKIIMKPVSSFTEKLSGITKKSIGKKPKEIEEYINEERRDRWG